MKRYFPLLLSSAVVLLGSAACSSPKQSEDVAPVENTIRMGNASLTVNLDAATPADSLRISLFSSPLLLKGGSSIFDLEMCNLERNGNTWTGEIAMDVTRKDVNVLGGTFCLRNDHISFFLSTRQGGLVLLPQRVSFLC